MYHLAIHVVINYNESLIFYWIAYFKGVMVAPLTGARAGCILAIIYLVCGKITLI